MGDADDGSVEESGATNLSDLQPRKKRIRLSEALRENELEQEDQCCECDNELDLARNLAKMFFEDDKLEVWRDLERLALAIDVKLLKKKLEDLNILEEEEQDTDSDIREKLLFKIWKKVADSGEDTRSMTKVGICYLEGRGTKMNINIAIFYLKMAAVKQDKNAILHIARHYQDKMIDGDLLQIKDVRKSNKENELRGEDQSEEELEEILEGTEYSPELREFLSYTILAASENDPQSLKILGYIYQNGLFGVKKSPKIALKLYCRAAEKKELLSTLQVAEMYYNGSENIPKDKKLAFEFLFKAAEIVPIPFWEHLGNAYKTGIGAPDDKVDIPKAVECYRKAINAGSITAKTSLGDLSWSNSISKKEMNDEIFTESAFELYEGAVSSGDISAMLGLARCYYAGIGVEKNLNECKRLLTDALEKLTGENKNLDLSDDNGLELLSQLMDV